VCGLDDVDGEVSANMGEPVSRQQFDATLKELCAGVADPRAGLFGPTSTTWNLNRHGLLFLGGGRALLLQTAHPWVAHAVEQHSRFREDPHGRGERTFKAVGAMVFGDLDMAMRAARRVHAVHGRVRGELQVPVGAFPKKTRYDANQVEGLLWVFATLWETSALVYDTFIAPLSEEEKEAYYAEGKRFAACFGIPREALPADWSSFLAYNERMWGSLELEVDAVSREIAHYVLKPPSPALAPLMAWYEIMTAGLMPERIRQQYRFAFGRLERLVYDASVAAIRAGYPFLPEYMKYTPNYFHARRRARGDGLYDPVALRIERLLFGRTRASARSETDSAA